MQKAMVTNGLRYSGNILKIVANFITLVAKFKLRS
jgi:hypothetical protein